MAESVHEAAPHHLPPFITAPGETDWLFVGLVCFILLTILLIGNLYFKLHALPEHMAHKAQSTQLQVVGVLALLALFTHNNVFWVAALLLAALRMPDFITPLTSIAGSAAEIAGRLRRDEEVPPAPTPVPVEPEAPAAPTLGDPEPVPPAPAADRQAD